MPRQAHTGLQHEAVTARSIDDPEAEWQKTAGSSRRVRDTISQTVEKRENTGVQSTCDCIIQ
jgi:hypothetical protein